MMDTMNTNSMMMNGTMDGSMSVFCWITMILVTVLLVLLIVLAVLAIIWLLRALRKDKRADRKS